MLQLSFECAPATAEVIATHLAEIGAVAVSLVDAGDAPLYEPAPGATPLWRCTRVTGLFDAGTDSGIVLERLRETLTPPALPPARVSRLEDRPWELECRRDVAPRCFAGRLWVVPSWEATSPAAPGQASMILDPGLAFGSGSHPTTRLCLHWLAGLSLGDCTVVDYGCGSGILAIAALKLGARSAVAVDLDPQALDATAGNARVNGVADRVRAVAPEDVGPVRADALVANILAGPLVALSATLASLVRPGAPIALGGLLAAQVDTVAEAFAPWFELPERRHDEEWVLLSGERREGAG